MFFLLLNFWSGKTFWDELSAYIAEIVTCQLVSLKEKLGTIEIVVG